MLLARVFRLANVGSQGPPEGQGTPEKMCAKKSSDAKSWLLAAYADFLQSLLPAAELGSTSIGCKELSA